MACPEPHPTSATSIPRRRRSTKPSTNGSDRRRSTRHRGPRRSPRAISSLEVRVARSRGRRRPRGSTRRCRPRRCPARRRTARTTAMLSGPGRPREQRGVLGRQAVGAPSRDRAPRSGRSSSRPATPARSARRGRPPRRSRALVDGAIPAIVSNSPVRCPTLTMSDSMPPFSDRHHPCRERLGLGRIQLLNRHVPLLSTVRHCQRYPLIRRRGRNGPRSARCRPAGYVISRSIGPQPAGSPCQEARCWPTTFRQRTTAR